MISGGELQLISSPQFIFHQRALTKLDISCNLTKGLNFPRQQGCIYRSGPDPSEQLRLDSDGDEIVMAGVIALAKAFKVDRYVQAGSVLAKSSLVAGPCLVDVHHIWREVSVH